VLTTDVPVTPDLLPDVPPAWKASAERVRRHLVALRGGAPFLSPNDAALIVSWLERGVCVAHVLGAIEAAADRRRAQRRRVPLALEHARQELSRLQKKLSAQITPEAPAPVAAEAPAPVAAEGDQAWPQAAAAHPLHALAEPLRRCGDHPAAAVLLPLGEALLALDPAEPAALLDAASLLITTALDAAWVTLGPAGRQPYLDLAHAALQDLANLLDEGIVLQLTEEHARGLLREELPALSTNALLRAVYPT
jgi:hypothetical protein